MRLPPLYSLVRLVCLKGMMALLLYLYSEYGTAGVPGGSVGPAAVPVPVSGTAGVPGGSVGPSVYLYLVRLVCLVGVLALLYLYLVRLVCLVGV